MPGLGRFVLRDEGK